MKRCKGANTTAIAAARTMGVRNGRNINTAKTTTTNKRPKKKWLGETGVMGSLYHGFYRVCELLFCENFLFNFIYAFLEEVVFARCDVVHICIIHPVLQTIEPEVYFFVQVVNLLFEFSI